MAEKEERIEQFITIQQRTITTRDYETNDEIISKIYTRQEAIEHMAKARYAQRPCYDKKGNEISFEDTKENYQLFYEDLIKEVEPLLNALLEGK